MILQVCWNLQHRSLLSVVPATAPLFQPLHQRNVSHPVANCFTWQTLPTVNRKHLFMNILCTESFCPQKTHNRTMFFGRILLKHIHHFECWNQPLNMCMAACLPSRLSWSLTVLLPSDTHRKHVTYLTAVLVPFVTYLLTLPRIYDMMINLTTLCESYWIHTSWRSVVGRMCWDDPLLFRLNVH
jgi:hypothetical protein